jgi:hypothetical protein
MGAALDQEYDPEETLVGWIIQNQLNILYVGFVLCK